MKTIVTKTMMLAIVLGGLILGGCSEISPKAFPFGPIPHDKEIDSHEED